MNDKNEEYFDLEKELDEQVKPLVDQLADKCKELRIPFVVGVNYRNVAETTAMARVGGTAGRSIFSRKMEAALIVLESERMAQTVVRTSAAISVMDALAQEDAIH